MMGEEYSYYKAFNDCDWPDTYACMCNSDYPLSVENGEHWILCYKYVCPGRGWNSSASSPYCSIWIDTDSCANSSCCPSSYGKIGRAHV